MDFLVYPILVWTCLKDLMVNLGCVRIPLKLLIFHRVFLNPKNKKKVLGIFIYIYIFLWNFATLKHSVRVSSCGV